jgi:signal transduction histidine kinase
MNGIRANLTGRILVVDGAVTSRHAATRTLRGGGHEVLETGVGPDVLGVAQAHRPELILLEGPSSEDHGVDLIERLKADAATAPISIVQIVADAETTRPHPQANAYLTPPLPSPLLLATVDALLRFHRSEFELREAVRTREEMLAIAAHDLRAPLTSMQLNLQLVQRYLRSATDFDALRQQALPHLERVTGQVDRLGGLLSDLLDVSQISSGRLNLAPEPIDLAEVTWEAAQRFEQEIAASGSRLSLRLQPHVLGRWDRLRLDQVISNLISNAIKYGGGNPIEVSLTTDADHAHLTVRDNGIGITPEHQARIFRPYERVGRPQAGSYGLGLWIVKALVDAMGGNIQLDSTPGEGTCFSVHVPVSSLPAHQHTQA